MSSAPATPPPAATTDSVKTNTPRKARAVNFSVARFWWALAMSVGFLLSFLLLGPSGEADGWSDDLSSATVDYTVQGESAESAPQQTVLNGWYTNDLLELQTRLAGDQADRMGRLSAMALFLGLGLLGDMVLRSADAYRAARQS